MKFYVLSINTENAMRVLQRIASVFSRHRINIEQLNVFATPCNDISHFSIAVYSEEIPMNKLVKQLSNIVELIDIKVEYKMSLPENTAQNN